MESIKETLAGLDRETPIQDRTTRARSDEPNLVERKEELRRSLNISSWGNTFENFKPVVGTEKSFAAFKALASGKTDWRMLLCYGGVGNGKTHLCEATVIRLYERGIFCRLLTMATIMRGLKGCMGREPCISYEELLSNYCYSNPLILDDVGMGGSGSDWEWGQLEEIIVVRYRERLFTIMTTNRDKDELPERVVSRFRDPDVGRVVLNSGEDYRRLKGKE